jgi:hypothetical protein
MDGLNLLQQARDAGLRLDIVGTFLKITGPKEAEPLVRLLAEHKAQVLKALQKVQEVQKVQKVLGTESGGTEREPGPYASALAALERRCPDYLDAAEWQQAIADAETFVSEWGAQAQARGWSPADLFGLHAPPEKPAATYRRLSRYDETGLIWLLQGRPVVALTETEAIIRAPSGANLTYRKHNKAALGPWDDCLDDLWAPNS